MLNSAAVPEAPSTPLETGVPLEDDSVDLRLGNYQLEEKLGHGGMGVVYRAHQLNLGRKVAVKLLLLGRHSSPESIRRFQREARAVASLRHPNIVSIFEVGEADGQHYFSMEYIEGEDLAQRLHRGPLAARNAAECLLSVAHAVEYAHSQGVLHRDLKPSNVLIDAFGQPRLTDFGLAKPLDGSADLTETGRLLGSPNYLAPECVSAGQEAASPASDIYSLGAMLYELLTGRPPFLAQSLQDTLVRIRDSEPVSLRRLNPALPADLETICLRCLEKSPSARYPSAGELADDLGRWLRHEPIHARPVSVPERVWKWSRRNPRATVLLLATLLAGLGLLVTLAVANVRIRRANERTAQEAEASRRRLVQLNVQTGNRFMDEQDLLAALGWFVEALALEPLDRGREDIHRRRLGILLRETPQLEQLWPQGDAVRDGRLSPDESRAATISEEGPTRVWRLNDGEELTQLPQSFSIGFTADSRFLHTFSPREGSRLWDAWGMPAPGWPNPRHSLATPSTDGRFLAYFDRKGVVQIDLSNFRPRAPLVSPESVVDLQYAPGDQWLVGYNGRSQVFIGWNLPSGSEPKWVVPSGGPVSTIQMSPDGRRFAAVVDRHQVWQWELATGAAAAPILRLPSEIYGLTYSPDGLRLATAEWGGAASQWDSRSGQQLGSPLLHGGGVRAVRYTPDGQTLVSSSWDTTVRFWDANSGRPRSSTLRHGGFVTCLDLGTSGRRVLTGSQDSLSRLWQLPPESRFRLTLNHGDWVFNPCFSPDSRRVLTAGADGAVRVWDRSSGDLQLTLHPRQGLIDARFSPDGHWILAGSAEGDAWMWNATTGEPRFPQLTHGGQIHSVAFLPSGKRFVTRGETKVRLWDSATGQPLLPPLEAGGRINTVAIHPAGHRLLVGNEHGWIQEWDLNTGQPRPLRLEIGMPVRAARYSPDGRRIVTSGADTSQHPSAAQIWDAESGQPVVKPMGHLDGVTWAEFSPDGRLVATAAEDNSARVWDATTGEPLTPPLRHRSLILVAVFSPDGRLVATAGEDHTVRLWESETGEPVALPLEHSDAVNWVQWSPDGREIVTGGWSNPARLFDLSPTEESVDRLRLRAELLASQKLNPNSGASTLNASELLQRWQSLTADGNSRKK